MKNKKLLFSFIIPTYNNENTIERAIQSILNQDVSPEIYEIIVVDDKSSDKTYEKVELIKNKNIALYQLHQNSGGASAPRNFGISKAKGKFVYFLDSDDWLRPNILRYIINHKHLLSSDMIIAKTIKVTDKSETVHARFLSYKNRLLKDKNDIPYLIYYLGPQGKFLNNEILQKNDLKYPIDMHFGEDKIFFLNFFNQCKKVSTITKECGNIDRTTDNHSMIQQTDFYQKRKSDYELFKEIKKIKNPKFKDKFYLRIVEYDMLNNCDSHVFNKLPIEEKEAIFNIIKEVFTTPYIRENILQDINVRYKNAVQFVLEDDFKGFCEYFKWLKSGKKKFSYSDNGRLQATDLKQKFSLEVHYANLLEITETKKYTYIQILLSNIDESRISGVLIESRTLFSNNINIKDLSFDHNILTVKIDHNILNRMAFNIFNVYIVYDGYKNLNVKFGYEKRIKNCEHNVTFYPTVNGNLSIKHTKSK